jgi:hypothetical protein
MIKTITVLFKTFLSMCFFRYKPQALPQSIDLLMLCLVVYIFINVLLAMTTAPFIRALQISVLETVMIAIITIIILRLNHHHERWVKTLMAITGTGCVIGLFALPLFAGAFLLQLSGFLQTLIMVLYLTLLIWNIVIMGHILRHAMETTLSVGIVFAMIYLLITSTLISVAIPRLEFS